MSSLCYCTSHRNSCIVHNIGVNAKERTIQVLKEMPEGKRNARIWFTWNATVHLFWYVLPKLNTEPKNGRYKEPLFCQRWTLSPRMDDTRNPCVAKIATEPKNGRYKAPLCRPRLQLSPRMDDTRCPCVAVIQRTVKLANWPIKSPILDYRR